VAVISRRSKNFRKLYAELPAEVQRQAVKSYALWKADPWHPSLDFKARRASPDWSVRVGLNARAMATKRPDGSYLWYWIGTHEAYNKF
jgi:hypothetical protein